MEESLTTASGGHCACPRHHPTHMTRQEQFERKVKNLLAQYSDLTYEQVHTSFEWAESFVRYKHLIEKEK